MNWTLQVEEGKLERIQDAAHLRERLARLQEESKADPLFALLNAPDESCLAVGLGRDLSVLSYTAPGGWPARHVVGGERNDGLVSYKFLGHFSEMPAHYAVPISAAIDAAVEFFASGRLSDVLQWEDD